MLPNVIAIDGPAASGKTTIAELLAKKLGYLYLDTGVMYRAVTLVALERGIDLQNEEAVSRLAREVKIEVRPTTIADGRKDDVILDGDDVTWDIRTPAVDKNVSIASAYPGVRVAMTEQQRNIAKSGKIILAGRDIGTVVLPQADLKIYLEASAEARAQRRLVEIRQRGKQTTYEEIYQDMLRRDLLDSSRAVAPLRPADDAIIIDTDKMSIDQVMEQVMALLPCANRQEKE